MNRGAQERENSGKSLEEQEAQALLDKVIENVKVWGWRSEDLAIYDDILERFGRANINPEIIAKAYYLKGNLLYMGKEDEKALQVYDALISRFEAATEFAIVELVAKALFNKAAMLNKQNPADGVPVFDELVSRYVAVKEASLRSVAARALVMKAATLGEMERYREALSVCNEVLIRFGDTAEDPSVQQFVAEALCNKAGFYYKLGSSSDEMASYDELLARFSDSTEPQIRASCADVLLQKAAMLAELQRAAEALAAYDELGKRYGGPNEIVAVYHHVANGLKNKADFLQSLGRTEEAVAVYDYLIDLCRERSPKGMMRTFQQEEAWLWDATLQKAESAKAALAK